MKKIAHRGARGHEPENTLLSMRTALEMGVDGIEFDVHLSKDGEPVVIHDDTLERTTNGHGPVAAFTYQQLAALDAGKGEKIPHLREVFALADTRCGLLIELKMDAVAATEALIREQVAKGWDYGQLWVLAFDHRLLAKMKRLNPHIHTCANMEKIPADLAAVDADAIGPRVDLLDAALVQAAHARGLKVFTWTANDPRDIAHACALKVDGMIGDYPERL